MENLVDFDSQIKFLNHWLPQAEVRSWQEGEARIIGIFDPRFQWENQPAIYFGYWSSQGNFSEQQKIFMLLELWASNIGISKIIGPIDFSTFFNYRLRLDSFAEPTFMGEPQNSPIALKLLNELGYNKTLIYESRFYENTPEFQETLKSSLQSRLIKALEKDYSFYSFKEWQDKLTTQQIYLVTHQIFQDNPGFVPLPVELFCDYFAKKIWPLACLEHSWLVLTKEGELVGYALNFIELNNPNQLLIKTAGVIPAHRKGGLLFLSLLMKAMLGAPQKELVFCLMREGNFPSLLTQKWQTGLRKYALFKKDF